MKKLGILAIGLTLFLGCRKSQFDTVERGSGTANFSRYIAVGNSLTQGMEDGGLYEDGQNNSYPSMIAAQMQIVDPNIGDFLQPDVSGNGSGYLHLEDSDSGFVIVQPTDPNGYSEDPSWATWGTPFKYNNLGISGITLDQCVALNATELTVNQAILGGISFGALFSQPGNPYARFLDFGSSPFTGGEAVQYIDHIRQSDATFFTCWLGNNDILGYATSGGVATEIDLSLFGFGVMSFNALADPTVFRMKYDSVLTAFNDIGAQGVCATIPDVTVIPFFNQFTVQSIKAEHGYANVWIEDGSGTVRIATDADLITLNAADAIDAGDGGSESQYLTNDVVLDASEVSEIQSVTTLVNSAIKASAAQFGFGVVDMHDFLNTIKPGITLDGIDVSSSYIEGQAFSLDGIHLTPRGYAIAANKFIQAINDHYGSDIPTVAVGNYRGIVFP